MNFIDTHAHTYLEVFAEDEQEVFKRCRESGISKVIMPNVDRQTVDLMFAQERRFPEMLRSSLGLHPCSVKADTFREDLAWLEKLIRDRNIVAVGEIGIDLYWDKSTSTEQLEAYKIQLDWARELRIPALIHSRESLDLTISIAKEMQDGRLTPVFHCFNGTAEQGRMISDMNGYMGLGGVATYKNAGMDKVVPELSESNILLETDAPYLSPVPKRGKRNEPSYLLYTAERLAIHKKITLEDIADMTTRNALRIFPN